MKKLLYFCLVVSIAISTSACISKDNIASVQSTIESHINNNAQNRQEKTNSKSNKKDEYFANSEEIYATEKYIYYVSTLCVMRYDKSTLSASRLTDSIADIVGISKDTIYFVETDPSAPRLYKITDKMQSPEFLYSLSNDEKFFLVDNYIYSVSQNGSVTKHKNSKSQYHNSAKVIYRGAGGNINETKLYNKNIYCIDRNEHKITSISLNDGTSNVINLQGDFKADSFGTSMHNNSVRFCDNKIIYADNTGILHIFDIKTNTFSNIDSTILSFFVANGTLYAANDTLTETYIIDTTTSSLTTTTISDLNMFRFSYTLSDTGSEIVYTTDANRLIICDYDGNKISETRQW